ncbi:ATP-dependent sacrificial sulfur transferase LarE [Roseiconus lacunae]|uniref:ATP-dependent sacrificial sulfur transferase LarE n=1 Tax=Roseiconus lacunae TaxID=2605694 RepID=UPI0011F35609|nr:ATP-dependent sacrificial sulfur transferase LarE [Roseiconus lacunae]
MIGKLPQTSDQLQRLVDWFANLDVVVAFSGGVDSSVVLAAALRNSSASVTAVTAVSPSVAQWQVEIAKRVAEELGVPHRLIPTGETDLPAYQANDRDRCFHCKSTLYATVFDRIEAEKKNAVQSANATDSATKRNWLIVSGTNADDLGDYRPGIAAGDAAGIRKPLAELQFGKSQVRQLAKELGLSNADLPASPCLASRIAYGVEVTVDRLKRVESAETLLHQHGFTICRVRLHEGELARIEVPADAIHRFCEPRLWGSITKQFREFGFQYVTLDLEGFQSGSLNRPLVSIGDSDRSPQRHQVKGIEPSLR